MDDVNNKLDHVDSLEQMSEDMKLHIAQLKAELGNSDSVGSRTLGQLHLPVSYDLN